MISCTLSDTTRDTIERARTGDREAFDALARAHRPALAAAVRARLGPHLRGKVEHEDVVQETFLKAFVSIRSFHGTDALSFSRWLRAIAENILLYWAREHQRKDQLPLIVEPPGSAPPPSQQLRREERFERLACALGRLTPAEREALILARLEGLKMTEVAARLGISPVAARQGLWRALSKLRARLDETESFGLPRDRALGDGEREAGEGT
jgi:RNA polymerase sigma-70 factor (ECF subfamily)